MAQTSITLFGDLIQYLQAKCIGRNILPLIQVIFSIYVCVFFPQAGHPYSSQSKVHLSAAEGPASFTLSSIPARGLPGGLFN